MTIRRSSLLLCTVALVATGCSADMARFAPSGGVAPSQVDMRSTGSVLPSYGGRPTYNGPSAVSAASGGAAPVPAANVTPRAPAGWPPRVTNAPAVYGALPPRPSASNDTRPTGSIGIGPVRGSSVTSTALPAPAAPSTTTPTIVASATPNVAGNARPNAAVASGQSEGIAQRVRRALPSMPDSARTPAPERSDPLRTRVAAAKAAIGWNGEGGRVTVGEGQTLYNLSKRFGVPVSAIMAANSITDPTTVQAGQSLVIPRYTYDRANAVSAPDADPNVRASTAGRGMIGEVDAANVPAPSVARSANASVRQPLTTGAIASSGSVTVGSGDTLYSIARRSGVSLTALREANGLTSDAIRIGQTLRLPAGGFNSQRPAVAEMVPERPATAQAAPARVAPLQVAAVRPAEPALAAPVVTDAPEATPASLPRAAAPADGVPARASDGEMRWPVNGRVVRGFGGAQKGIDIAVPSGTAVRAAEDGTVIYAGSGLKELGKTVLIQHPGGLVTVYGHADALKVAKGQKVQRGDLIASSGMTGDAETPRVHFQVRKGSTPVNPDTYLN